MKRFILVMSLLGVGPFPILGEDAQSISDSIVVFPNGVGLWWAIRTTYFGPDGTYQDLFLTTHSPGKPPDRISISALDRGSYEFSFDPENPNEGTLVQDQDWSRTLIYTSPYSGRVYAPMASFRILPRLHNVDLRNVSNRAWINPQRSAISGFILDRDRLVLVRCAGPALEDFGVTGALPKPRARIHSKGLGFIEIPPWSVNEGLVDSLLLVFEMVNAFPFQEGSQDCAAVMPLGARGSSWRGSY
jgi:hypothetical protein